MPLYKDKYSRDIITFKATFIFSCNLKTHTSDNYRYVNSSSLYNTSYYLYLSLRLIGWTFLNIIAPSHTSFYISPGPNIFIQSTCYRVLYAEIRNNLT